MNRREALMAGAAMVLSRGITRAQDDPAAPPAADAPVVMTVKGPIDPKSIGTTLPHEHVLVDFIGADRATPDRYDRALAAQVVTPHLKRIKELGCTTFVECTPAYLGRDPQLLKQLSDSTGMNILTNTGLYAAGNGKYLPTYVNTETPDQLSARWLKDWTDGIGDTGVRPGFVKIGVDAGPLNDSATKLVQAAARTHKASGLTIVSHTGDGRAAVRQLELLVAEGITPAAWIWAHAQNEPTKEIHMQVAGLGGWVEFDGISANTIEQYADLVQNMKRANMLNRVLISHDAGWYHVGEPDGGAFRPYDTIFTTFLPMLQKRGFTIEDFRLILVDNPQAAFTIRKRLPA